MSFKTTAASSALALCALLLAPMAQAGPGHAGHGGGSGHGGAGASAVGEPGEASKASRTVRVSMDDNMRFSPSKIAAQKGETLRLVVSNKGKIPHELVLGEMKGLREHAELMKKFPGMEHDEPNMVTVKPGESAELIWRFASAGTVDFACLLPGHFEAGMKGAVEVR